MLNYIFYLTNLKRTYKFCDILKCANNMLWFDYGKVGKGAVVKVSKGNSKFLLENSWEHMVLLHTEPADK